MFGENNLDFCHSKPVFWPPQQKLVTHVDRKAEQKFLDMTQMWKY
jgi:hypothetical protein